MKKKILTVVGARPQFVKAAVLSRCLRTSSKFSEVLVHTGQHYDANLSDIFFDELGIPKPDYSLNISQKNKNQPMGHGKMTGQILSACEEVLLFEKPDAVLVYGDTNSTLAGALAASKLNIPILHVEAGLRSFNQKMPEEINRVLTDHVSALLFCPNQNSMQNLIREGLSPLKIFNVGDVMYDATLFYARKSSVSSGKYVLATIHRAENTDDPICLRNIFAALNEFSKLKCRVIVPLHPRTKAKLNALGILTHLTQLEIIKPVGYLEMLSLEKHAEMIITDSGGVQKEAYFFRVPCLTLRNETEWIELVQAGWNTLVKPGGEKQILEGLMAARRTPDPNAAQLFGTGKACEAIVEVLESQLC